MPDELLVPLAAADPHTFTGPARSALLGASADGAALKLYYVRFDAGARTHWHAHEGTQILLVREGRCRLQREGASPEELGPGETASFGPGERHWHGASPDAPMAHLAVNLHSPATRWMEPVDERQYAAHDASAETPAPPPQPRRSP